MDFPLLQSIPHVADVERFDGAAANRALPPTLLVEVPHGADQRAHYDALRARLVGALPADLHVYFHVNTDIGAYDWGRRVAERVVAAEASRSALLVRCLVPRTFVDANRLETATEDLARSGLTAGVAPYVRDERDLALLLSLHRAYVQLVEQIYPWVCEAGGFALSPHTYGPRTMGIEKIDDEIVAALRRAHEPAQWERWPVRPEVDLITRSPDGRRLAPPEVVDALLEAYRAQGIEAVDSRTYLLHASAQGTRWAERYPDRFLCLEVRRDLLVESYTPFDQMRVRPEAIDRYAAPVADAIDAWLRRRA